MKATIMIPVHNAEKFLPKALDSALNQTYVVDYEIVAINDGSTDATGEILEEYSKRCPRIRVFHQENKGTGETRNRLLKESYGEILLGLDADDFLHERALGAVVRYFDYYPRIDVVYTDNFVVGEKGRAIKERKKQEVHKQFKDAILHCHFPGHLRAFRRCGIKRGFDSSLNKMSEDYDFLLNMVLQKWPEVSVGHIPESLYFYRVNPNGLNQNEKSVSGDVLEKKLNEYKVYGNKKMKVVPISVEGITFLGHKIEGIKEIKAGINKILLDYLKESLI